MKETILIVCQDAELQQDLTKVLSYSGEFKLEFCDRLINIHERIKSLKPIVTMIVDIEKFGGVDLIRQVRDISFCGMMVFSSQPTDENKTVLLNAGADVVLDLAFNIDLLKASLRRLVIRIEQLNAIERLLESSPGVWKLHTQDWVLSLPDGQRVELTETEFKLLKALLLSSKLPVERNYLALHIGRQDCDNYDSYINTLIYRVRKKILNQTDQHFVIKSFRSKGYAILTPTKMV